MAALAVAGVLGLGVALGAVQGVRLLQAIEPPDVPVKVDPATDFGREPRNVLVLGADIRAGLTPEEQERFGGPEDVEGRRSDTIILMHVDPRREQAVIVHFPRDLRVRIPGHGRERINMAFELGGPDLAVRTVRRFTGLPIHNYVQVDLAGFQDVVDTLGGVRICVDRPMFDELAGLAIPSAGCHSLDGDEALAFVRARNVEGDLIPDFSRIARQQQFMRAMMNRLLSVKSLLDADLIAEAASNVTTDEEIEGADFVYLGSKLREIAETDPSGATALDFRVVPSEPRTIDGVAYVVADQPETKRLFRALRRGKQLGSLGQVLVGTSISPATITVRVLDAGTGAEARAAQELLRRGGFIVLETEDAPGNRERSQILYAPGAEDHAEVVAGYFPGLPVRQGPETMLGDADVVVVAGDDYGSVVTP